MIRHTAPDGDKLMRASTRGVLACIFLIGGVLGIGTPPARAQGSGPAGSLGGYGGSMTDVGSGMGMSGPVIPYAGKFGGFMPYRMGGSGSLSFQSRGAPAMGSPRTSFGLSPMSGGMGQGMGTLPRFFPSSGMSGATGLGGGMNSMSGPRGMGVMPPNFGYPFRQPPSLLSPSSPGAGMSM